MKTNESLNSCPRCGAPVPAEAPEGLCPRCVLAAAAAPEPAPTATSQIPSLERLAVAFPQLQILELIGRGGMGFVFKARQPHLDRFVALKLLPDSLAQDSRFAERFNREGRVLARLNHPNIVSIFDFGYADPRRAALQSRSSDEPAGRAENSPPSPASAAAAALESHAPSEGGFYYLMMEYVDGVNLRQAMQAGRFSPAEALTIVPKICEALQFAHEEGILHRDIKPENILLDTKGRVKIADFGIAKLVGEDKPDVSLTATGAALGTMHYMAPEQIEKPATVDHRADIYSLGVVFYELLTGELPLGRFGPPSAKTPVDSRVDDVVMRTLEREREKRFQSAGEMGTTVEHLTEVGAGARPSTPKPTPATPTEDFILCHPRLPRMAQFITIFALVVTPALWFVGLMTMDTTPHPNAYAEFVQVMMRPVTFWGELLTTVLIFIGGWKLRALKKSGPRLLSVAVWINMVLIALVIASLILIEKLVPTGEGGDKPLAEGEAVLVALQCGALIFQIITLVWLRRNRAVLDNIFQSATGSTGPRGTIIITAQTHLVRRPAQALLATGIVNGVVSIFVLYLLAYTALGETWTLSPAQLAVVAGLILLSSLAIIFGALKMMEMESYLLSVAASVLAMITTPGSIIGLPIGLWALVTLRRAEVRAGFTAMAAAAPQRSSVLKWALVALLIIGAGVAVTIESRSRPEAGRAAPLPEGMVELVALSRHPTDGVWWRPDGTTSTDGPFENTSAALQVKPGQQAVLFVFRSRDLERGDSSRTYLFEAGTSWVGGGPPRFQGQPVRGGSFVAAAFPESLRETTVRVGVAIDSWATVAQDSAAASRGFSLSRQNKPHKVRFLGAVEGKGGDLVLTLTHNFEDEDSRVVAVDAQGRERANFSRLATGDRHSFTIANLGLAEVREFRFQVRTYRWAEFKNVQLNPSTSAPARAPLAAAADTNTTPWIRFTFTAVELREVQGVRWLAIDYLGDVHGECQKAFPWETTIPGFKPVTRTSEFRGGDTNALVRHQRVEYQMPDSVPRDQLERFRDNVAKALNQRSFRLELGEERLLFELVPAEGGSLTGWMKAVPPLGDTPTPLLVRTAELKARRAQEHLDKVKEDLAIGRATPEDMAAAERELVLANALVKARRDAATKAQPSVSPQIDKAAPSLAFAPTVERMLYDYKSGKDWLLNLESGETFSLPPGMSWDKDAPSVWAWAHQRGIHVTGLNVASQHGLYGFEMKAAIVRETNVIFESITPMQIAAAMKGPLTSVSTHNGGPPLFQLSGLDWKNLYAFETDEGRTGVLQVTGFVENPRGVKFRYKLVQTATNAAPAKQF